MIIKENENIIIDIVRKSILEVLEDKSLLNKELLSNSSPFLKEPRAVFVTLQIKDNTSESFNLRGCMGSILPRKPLIDDLIYNAKSAAFHDPRFKKLTVEEFEKIHIEVSLLSIPQKIEYHKIDQLKDIIIPFKHGVILEKGFRRATFLPSVWEKLPEFDMFFDYLCRKAGMGKTCLDDNPNIKIYTAQKISE